MSNTCRDCKFWITSHVQVRYKKVDDRDLRAGAELRAGHVEAAKAILAEPFTQEKDEFCRCYRVTDLVIPNGIDTLGEFGCVLWEPK